MTLPGSSATMMRTSRSPLPRGGGVSIMIFLVVTIFFASTPPTQALRFLGDTETFAKYPKWNACQNATLSFEFQTRQPSALLVFTDNNVRYDYLQLALTKGAIRLWISFEAEERQVVDIEANTEALNDGQWHRVEIRRNRMETLLYVDGLPISKVALGTESDAAEEPTQNNYVFFGGIPSNYAPKLRRDLEGLPQQFFDIKFRGDIRNILYFNCSCIPVRAAMVEGRGVSRDPPEQCDVRNPCPEDCPCVSVDDGSGCECKYKRECLKDILASYHLPMDQVEQGTLVNPSRLDSLVEGGPQLTRGVKENALLIDGRSQWLRVVGGSHRRECMGDLARCEKGYYMGMWLQFRGAGYQRGVYLSNGGHSASNHGVALLYSKGRLDVIFKMKDGREWRTRSHNVLEDRWYHVSATWSQAQGLHLYINGEKAGHDGSATQKRAASDNTQHNGFYIGRANDNSGTDRLGQVLVDDFVFESTYKDPREIREAGAIYHYYEPMDEIRQDRLVGGKGLDGRVYGAASRVDGKVGGAVLLSGGREYLDLGDVAGTCLGDLDLCQYGLYVSLWVLFNRVDGGKKTLLSSPAMSLHQEGNLLVASVNNLRQHWETRYQGLDIGAWYFVELSWSPTDGLSLYVGRQRVGYQPSSTYQPPEAAASMSLYVGRDGSRSSGYPAATVDELEMFYADRSTLSEINFIERGRPTNQHFDMDSIRRGRLENSPMVVTMVGQPRTGPGKVGSAVVLDGFRDALDFGDKGNDCFGNLDLCPHGVLVSLWLKPERLEEQAYFLSSGTNGLTMSYRAGKLQVRAATTTKTWEISTSDFTTDKWHFLEVSFHPERGLHLYQNGALVAESEQSEQRSNPTPARYERNRFYLGRGNVDMAANKFGAGAYDELDVWYADRDYLTSQGFIQRSRPESVIVHFEESPDQTQIIHPTLDIRLIGRPGLIPGKVGNALQLRGRGQYADLGQLSHKCMGNLALCQQGITVSGWMKFRSFENNMVFLSSGESGLLMYYRDGYMHVSADGRSVITVPPFETERWYHVEMSWHPDHGLKLFVDNKLLGETPAATPSGSGRRNAGHFYIGRPNDGDVPGVRYTTANFDVDELEVWSGRREDLLAFGYIERDELGHEAFSMDSAQGDRLNHPRFIVLLVNGASLGPGRVGQALQLNGRGQYLDLGPHLDSCLGNLDNCPHGFTLSVWLKPNSLAESQHFISAPSYALFYEDGQLTAEFNSAGRSWTASTPRFREGVWQRVTLAWHSKKGLTLYLDDELQDTDGGVERLQRDRPASEHVYVGRNLADTRSTADVQADEMQVWYDYLDQLRATGQYQVEVSPRRITFDNFRDGYITLRDRRIQAIGNVQLVQGLGRDSRALYLDGRTQYLDLGSNFTCNGNLDTCKQGATFRFALKPDRLVDGTYFVDSFPVKLYYKDGRLYAEMQTKDRVWTVDTSEIRANQYSRVELSWHPTLGLTMTVNGRRVDYETFPRSRNPVSNSDWRTYLGRPLNEADGLYANTAVDNIEFYNAYSSYIPQDTYLQLIRDQPPYIPPTAAPPVTRRPPGSVITIIGDIGVVTTQRPPVVRPDGGTRDRSRTTIVRFDGRQSYVRFNFDRLPPAWLVKTDEEEFSFWFLTKQPDGLIWFHDEPSRNLYIAMKNGKLVFVNDDKQGRPEEVTIGARSGRRFDDYRWHRLRIRKNGRRIRITVDDADQEEYIFSDDVQFLTPADVWLGGTSNTVEKTNNNIKTNFIGGVAEVNYISTSRVGQRTYRNEVDLIAQLGSGDTHGSVDVIDIENPFRPGTGTGVVVPPIVPTRRPPVTYPTTPRPTPRPTPPPAPRTTSVTIAQRGVVIPVAGMNMRSGSSVSFNFATINQDGLILFAGDPGSTYMAVELVDGRLYFVHNFGRRPVRTPFSQRVVADGQNHEVEMRFYGTHVDLRVDDVRERMDLTSGERLPTNLGTMYVAGYPNYEQLPWMLWGRESYLGCLNDLRVDSRIVDFETQVQQLFGRVTRGCQAMPQDCTRVRPCVQGECRNTMTDFLCDCSRTAFRGERCNLDAWTALFNGSVWAKLDFSRTQKTHADDISLRFRSPLKDGLLFETFAKGSSDFIRCSLENGRVKVETNLGGELKTMYTGENLNDFNWHTAYIKRRGNEMEVWVDDEAHTKATLAGSGYFMNVDRVYLGGHENTEENRYIGYLQNFHMGGQDVLEGLRGTGLNVNKFVSLPPLLYHPVTFPDLNTFVELPPLRMPEAMALHFMFKTEEPSGVMLFSSGSNQDYLVVEMFEGKLYIQLNQGGASPLHVESQGRVDDGKWHAVTIRRTAGDQRQFLYTVDGVVSSITYPGVQDLNLKGPLYIGGAPEELLQRDYIKKGVFSRIGFRGCMASMDLSGQVPDLLKFAGQQGVTIFDSCQAIIPRACTADSCRHFGECIESGAGKFTCDCSMTAHSGVTCQEEPIGFRYRNFSSDGLLIYSFPQQPTSTSDEIAFGVMTKQNNAVLLRVFSELINDYIEFRVRDGYIVADYDTNGSGGKHTVAQSQVLVNDGDYHHVRFLRTPNDAQLFVDQRAGVKSTHSTAHGSFDRMSTMYIGGGYDARAGKIQNSYDGIIGGLHINDLMVFPQSRVGINTRYVGDVVEAPRPFNLAGGGVVVVITTPAPAVTPKPPVGPIIPPIVDGGPVVIPSGVGGGGAGWVPGPAGVDTVLYPGGTGGTAVLVPGPGAAAASGPVVSAMVATPPALPSSGPRAGAVVGTILGLMVLGSSMMWAFYRCKPGYCACLKPPADAPMAISSPRGGGLSASNKGAVIAAGGGGLSGAGAGAGASANGAGAGGAGAGGGGANSFSNFYMSQSSNSASAGGGGAGGGEAYDATLRATGTFSNKGTAIGTPKPARAHLGSTASAVSGGGYSGYRESASHVRSASESVDGNVLTPASIQSYHYEGAPGSSTTADYDLATGVGSGYQSNTMSAGGGSMGGGTLGGGGGAGGFSSSTMQSSYNYSVKTVRTVSGQNQMSGYAGQGQVGVPPGALGEEVRVDCCLMTNDGHSVVTGSSLGPPQVWDMQSGELLRIMAGETVGSTNLHLACNDRLLVGAINADLEANQSSVPKGVHNYMLQIWDFTTGRALEMADVEVCSALTMMSDNDKVVFARSDKFGGGTNVVVWDLLGNQPIKHMRYDAPVGNNDYVHFIDLSQNDRYVVAGFTNSFDNFAEFVVFDMTLTSYTVSDPSILRLDANPECTAILPRDEAVTGLRNGDLVIWSLRTGQPSRQLLSGSGRHAHAREVKAVAVSEDNKYLVSASDDGTLKIWDVESERHINTLSGHTDEVWCCAISPDSEIVVSGSRDKTIRLWRLKNGSEICSFNAGVDIFHCTMSRDKSTIVALGDKMGARKLIMLQVVRTKVRRQVSS